MLLLASCLLHLRRDFHRMIVLKNRKRDRSNLKALFIPGGHDDVVIRLAELHCEKELKTLAGATHLFGEPGALEAVAHLAADGFASFRAIHRN
jgi:hypothetical protein